MSDLSLSFASFAGVDLHKNTVTLRAVDPGGKPISALTCDTKCVDRIRNWMLALVRTVSLQLRSSFCEPGTSSRHVRSFSPENAAVLI